MNLAEDTINTPQQWTPTNLNEQGKQKQLFEKAEVSDNQEKNLCHTLHGNGFLFQDSKAFNRAMAAGNSRYW